MFFAENLPSYCRFGGSWAPGCMECFFYSGQDGNCPCEGTDECLSAWFKDRWLNVPWRPPLFWGTKFIYWFQERFQTFFAVWPDGKDVINVSPPCRRCFYHTGSICLCKSSIKIFPQEGGIRVPITVPFTCKSVGLVLIGGSINCELWVSTVFAIIRNAIVSYLFIYLLQCSVSMLIPCSGKLLLPLCEAPLLTKHTVSILSPTATKLQ